MITIPDIAPLLVPLEDAIRIPALTGYATSILRDLLALPCRLGGMWIANPMDIADPQFDASIKVTAPKTVDNRPIINCLSTRCPFY